MSRFPLFLKNFRRLAGIMMFSASVKLILVITKEGNFSGPYQGPTMFLTGLYSFIVLVNLILLWIIDIARTRTYQGNGLENASQPEIWEKIAIALLSLVVSIAIVGQRTRAARLFNLGVKEAWNLDACGMTDSNLVLALDGIHCFACLFLPIRAHIKLPFTLSVPLLYGLLSFILGSPESLSKVLANLLLLIAFCWIQFMGYFAAEAKDRKLFEDISKVQAQAVAEKVARFDLEHQMEHIRRPSQTQFRERPSETITDSLVYSATEDATNAGPKPTSVGVTHSSSGSASASLLTMITPLESPDPIAHSEGMRTGSPPTRLQHPHSSPASQMHGNITLGTTITATSDEHASEPARNRGSCTQTPEETTELSSELSTSRPSNALISQNQRMTLEVMKENKDVASQATISRTLEDKATSPLITWSDLNGWQCQRCMRPPLPQPPVSTHGRIGPRSENSNVTLAGQAGYNNGQEGPIDTIRDLNALQYTSSTSPSSNGSFGSSESHVMCSPRIKITSRPNSGEDFQRQQQLDHPQASAYLPTPFATKMFHLYEVLRSWNSICVPGSCCPFHDSVQDLKKIADALSKASCNPLWSPFISGQCQHCLSMTDNKDIEGKGCWVCGASPGRVTVLVKAPSTGTLASSNSSGNGEGTAHNQVKVSSL
eukprot:gnl/MRDRNA2_/MRDRNA2_14445_c0_seq2.p1 gnl/MRDRNA2_/MRDRNA2_14445_c0~~gnl/MRDRNA2_/MRDRNA2_14445_c0_seq2.p1  ORF type:complete len:706 (-),score=68.64 gnl/MRDRNA2_/MRDRNA2_14445_c0_seq2:12-1985(-)